MSLEVSLEKIRGAFPRRNARHRMMATDALPPDVSPRTMSTTSAPPFERHYPESLEHLRGALTELYLALEADPDRPQDVSRRFGLHRNLAWKLTRVMRSQGAGGVLPYLPGNQGIERVIEAFRDAGAPEDRLDALRRAQEDFESMVALHAGDRATLELMLDSLGLEGEDDPLEASRRLAFRGNSGIWGIQARTRLRADWLAPNPDDASVLDLAQVSGLVDLRRFRPDATWPLFYQQQYNDDGSRRESAMEPIGADDTGSYLWPEFCTTPRPEVRAVPTTLGTRYELVGRTIGNRGRTTSVQGAATRRFAPRYRDAQNTRGSFSAQLNAPAEHLLFDLILHRDLVGEVEPEVLVLQADGSHPQGFDDARRIPCSETLRRLETSPPRLATPLFQRYGELVDQVYAHMGWRAEDFRALRFEMKCPPLHSVVLLKYDLPAAP